MNLHTLFDQLVLWGTSVGLLGASVAALLWVPAPLKRYAIEGLLAAFLLVTAYHFGFDKMQAKCQAAAEESHRKLAARDIEIAQNSMDLETHLTKERELKDQIDQKVAAYEKKLSVRGACPVSDADRKRLRSIR